MINCEPPPITVPASVAVPRLVSVVGPVKLRSLPVNAPVTVVPARPLKLPALVVSVLTVIATGPLFTSVAPVRFKVPN